MIYGAHHPGHCLSNDNKQQFGNKAFIVKISQNPCCSIYFMLCLNYIKWFFSDSIWFKSNCEMCKVLDINVDKNFLTRNITINVLYFVLTYSKHVVPTLLNNQLISSIRIQMFQTTHTHTIVSKCSFLVRVVMFKKYTFTTTEFVL